MKRRGPVGWRGALFFLLALLMLRVPAAATAEAGSRGAERFISTVGQSVITALAVPSPAARARRFHSVFNRYANVRAVAQFALGKYARRLKANQRSEYYRLAKRYIVNTLFEGLYTVQIKRIKITGYIETGGFIVVSSNFVLSTGENYPVKWRLLRRGRSYRIVDLNVFGVWFALLHRTKFANIISAGGGKPESLMAHLRRHSGGSLR